MKPQTASSTFPFLASTTPSFIAESQFQWNAPLVIPNFQSGDALVQFSGSRHMVKLGVIYMQPLQETYGISSDELSKMRALPTAAEQRDFCDASGKRHSRASSMVPVSLVSGEEAHPQEQGDLGTNTFDRSARGGSSSLDDYFAHRARLTEPMEHFANERNFSIIGEPDLPFVNLTHQTANELYTNTGLRGAFKADITRENPMGLDYGAIHDALMEVGQTSRSTEVDVLNGGSEKSWSFLPKDKENPTTDPDPIPDPNPDPVPVVGNVYINRAAVFATVHFRMSDSQEMKVTIPTVSRYMVYDANAQKGYVRNEDYQSYFELSRSQFQMQKLSSTSIGFDLGIALGNAPGQSVNDEVKEGDPAHTTPEYKEKLTDKEEPVEAPKPGNGETPDPKVLDMSFANIPADGQRGLSASLISGTLGFRYVSQKLKSYEKDELKFITENTARAVSRDDLDFS